MKESLNVEPACESSPPVRLSEHAIQGLSKSLGRNIDEKLDEKSIKTWFEVMAQTLGFPWQPSGTIREELERILTLGKNEMPGGLTRVNATAIRDGLDSLVEALDTFERIPKDIVTGDALDLLVSACREAAKCRAQDFASFAATHSRKGRSASLIALEHTARLASCLFMFACPRLPNGRIDFQNLKPACRAFVMDAMADAGFEMTKYVDHPERLDSILWKQKR